MLTACALFVFGDTIFKVLWRHVPLGEMLLIRSVVAVPMILPLVARSGALQRIGVALTPRVLLRTALEVSSTVLFFVAFFRMNYADAIAIHQFTPLAVTAGAALFLGEPVGWRRWMAA